MTVTGFLLPGFAVLVCFDLYLARALRYFQLREDIRGLHNLLCTRW